jgi:ribosomal protein L37E
MKDWTAEEIELALIYGTCEVCGGPRTTRTEEREREGQREVTMLMVCARCGREAT